VLHVLKRERIENKNVTKEGTIPGDELKLKLDNHLERGIDTW